MRARSSALIKILFQRINPFLMCVFSEARRQKNAALSAAPASLSYRCLPPRRSRPPESLMHYVAMIIT